MIIKRMSVKMMEDSNISHLVIESLLSGFGLHECTYALNLYST